ncbi:MAG TPA: glycosyltransferase family 87 protein [Vicinamibacterales bacterium]|nr:glycosyltransferase family 87 protein [Vicinamibacterales bacterium]
MSGDFSVYYRAGSLALQGDPDLYPADVRGAGVPVHYFRAAPATAWLFAPFALLPFRAAAFLFFALKAAGIAGIVAIASHSIGAARIMRWRIGLWAFAAAGGYMLEEMRYGNAHLLVLFGIVLALHLVRAGQVAVPAILLAISIAIKLTPVLVVFYLAVAGRMKVAVATAAIFLALLLLPALVFGWKSNNALLRAYASSAVQVGEQPRNHSLRGVVFRYTTSTASDGAAYPRVNLLELSRAQATGIWIAAAAILGGALIAAVRQESGSTTAGPLKEALVVIAMLLLPTHTQRIHFSALFYPLCVLMAVVAVSAAGRQRSAIRWTVAVSALAGTVLPLVLPGRQLSLAYEMGSPYFFVTLWLFVVVSWLIWHPGDASASPCGSRAESVCE